MFQVTPIISASQDDSHSRAVSSTSITASERLLNDDIERVPKMEYSIDHYEAIKAGIIDGSFKNLLSRL